ncbi:MAG: CCA tRNA nucleotidyltransferase [Candidatus Micrarchaeia archaeon]
MPANVDSLLSSILKEIKPTSEEIAIATDHANEIINRLRQVVPSSVELRLVGSLAHGTNLRGTSDIDVFLLFDKKKSKKRITQEGLDYAKKIVGKGDTIEIKYAEHPYARLYFGSMNIEADIVPAYKIENIEEMATAVDRSPMHTEFVLKHLSDRQKDDVRLLKYFLQNHDLYGAEVFTGGFSGYLCELLVYTFGSFLEVLKFFANASLPITINPKEERKHEPDASISKIFNSQFVVIDPVDPHRNVAAAVSIETLSKFVLLSRRFLEKPSRRSFYGYSFSHSLAKKGLKQLAESTGMDMFLIETRLPDKSEDILWPQLRRVSEQIKSYVESFGFSAPFVIPIVAENNGLLLVFSLKQQLRARIVKGPSVFLAGPSSAFLASHKKAIGLLIRGSDLGALETNRFATVKDVLESVCQGKMRKRHKDILLYGAKLHINSIPAQYVDLLYAEVIKALNRDLLS